MFDSFIYGDSITILIYLIIGLVVVGIFVLLLLAFGYIVFLWYKYRNREQEALKSTLLQVAVARDNEIKIMQQSNYSQA